MKPTSSVIKRRKTKRMILRPARMRWRNYLKTVCNTYNAREQWLREIREAGM